MIIPIEKLINYTGNSFKFSIAVQHRSLQLEELKGTVKAVPTAIEQILDNKIDFHYENE